MKRLGTLSIVIGLLGIIAIVYFNLRVEARYEEFGELVTLFIYRRTNKKILILSQLAGLIIGIMSGIKQKQTTGRIGLTICSMNLLTLIYQPY